MHGGAAAHAWVGRCKSPNQAEGACRLIRLAAVELVDAHLCAEPGKYLSALLLSLGSMLHLELPHVNVLSKADLVESYGELRFSLDYYTEARLPVALLSCPACAPFPALAASLVTLSAFLQMSTPSRFKESVHSGSGRGHLQVSPRTCAETACGCLAYQVQDLSRLVEGMDDDAFGRRYRRLSEGAALQGTVHITSSVHAATSSRADTIHPKDADLQDLLWTKTALGDSMELSVKGSRHMRMVCPFRACGGDRGLRPGLVHAAGD